MSETRMPDDTLQATIDRVEQHMQRNYRKSLSEMVISDTPGYWHDTEARMHPGHPLQNCMGFEGRPFVLTYSYRDSYHDARGRFASPYRSWRLIKEHMDGIYVPGLGC